MNTPFDQEQFEIDHWLDGLEREALQLARERAKRVDVVSMLALLSWSGTWVMIAVQSGSGWAVLPALAPAALLLWAQVQASGPTRHDDGMAAQLAELKRWMKKSADAKAAGKIEEYAWAREQVNGWKADIARQFRRGQIAAPLIT